MARIRRLPLLLACAAALLIATRVHAEDEDSPATPQRSDSGFTLRLLMYTRRQLTSSLGGLFQMTIASLLLWLQTTLVAQLRRRVISAFYLTAHIADPTVTEDLWDLAASQADEQQEAKRPARLVVQLGAPRGAVLARLRAACGVERSARWVGSLLACYVPLSAGPSAASDARNYVVLKPDDGTDESGGKSGSESHEGGTVVLNLGGGRLAWLHEREDGSSASAGGLLSGAPEPLLRLLENSGLRSLLAPKSAKRRRNDDEEEEDRGVYLSVLRWHGTPLIAEALRRAREHMQVELQNEVTLQVYTVKQKGKRQPEWNALRRAQARPMSTVVLPEEAATVRRQAHAFLSRRYAAFCTSKGIAQRAGYALWGPPGCGKTSFVSALAAELDAPLFTLTLDSARMTNEQVKKLIRNVMGYKRAILLIEDVDRLLPREMVGVPSGGDVQDASNGAAEETDEDGDDDGDDLLPSYRRGRPPTPPGTANKFMLKLEDKLSLEGLIEALAASDGPPCGLLLFLTTNHIDTLPRPLMQPGMVDATVQFTLGTVEMVRQLFINFYLLEEESEDAPAAASNSNSNSNSGGDEATPLTLANTSSNGTPATVVRSLAAAFAERVGECLSAMADVQGHLLEYRDDPQAALEAVDMLIARRNDRSKNKPAASDLGATPSVSSTASNMAPALSAAGSCLESLPLRDGAQESTGELLRRQNKLARTISSHEDEDDTAAELEAVEELARLARAAALRPLQRTTSARVALRPAQSAARSATLGPALSADSGRARLKAAPSSRLGAHTSLH